MSPKPLMHYRRMLSIVGICLGVVVVGIMFSSTNTALATIHRDLGTSLGELQWIMNIFGIFISSNLVIMGRLADLYGRKRVYLFGVVGLLVSQLGAGLAPSVGWIIFFQALFGMSGAVILPVSQALLTSLYPEKERSKAIGIWAAVVGVALGIGPLLAGSIIYGLGWRWIFLINVPIAVISFILIIGFLPKKPKVGPKLSLDWSGAFLLILTIGTFVLATIQISLWRPSVIAILYVLSIILLVSFLYVEKRARTPIIREDLFTHRTFMLSSLGNFCMLFFGWAVFFLIPLYLQTVQTYSVFQTGLMMLGVTVPLAILSPVVSRWYKKTGPKQLISYGFIFLIVSALIQMQYHADTNLLFIILGLLCYGIGWGLAWGPTTTAAISALPQEHAGVAAGTFTTLQEIGGTVGLAITGTVVRLHHHFMIGFYDGMWVLLMICFVGLIATLMMPARRKHKSV